MGVDGDASTGDAGDLRDVRLHARQPFHLRLDVAFGLVHAVTCGIAYGPLGAMDGEGAFERVFVVGLGAIAHALVALSTHWSVRHPRRIHVTLIAHTRSSLRSLGAHFRRPPNLFDDTTDDAPIRPHEQVAAEAALTCRKITPKEAKRVASTGSPAGAFALVTPTDGRREFCSIQVSVTTPPGDAFPNEDKDGTHDWSSTQLSFEHRSRVYRRDERTGTFQPAAYPDGRPVAWYVSRTGHNGQSAESARHKWGPNDLRVNRPGFWDIMREQLIAPFFVFQTFCCVLWLADEYWYYSLFTLAMLVVFESTVASQRLRNVDELMSLRPNGSSLLVHREGRWVRVGAYELVPGDMVSVTASGRNERGEEEVVPADLALIAGDAMSTEAMLTGESTPQRKHAMDVAKSAGNKVSLDDVNTIDKTHVLFAGTRVLRAEFNPGAGVKVGKPPDKGCVCVVVRTGFGTTQGELVRTILHTGERVTADSKECGVFIGILLLFASAASFVVALHGFRDPTRNRYRLFINCVTILTSVIPPELPMEMSIAVNTSLIALAKRRVYCTEPFRVTDAGRVDVCCFDKTGTLTEDTLKYEGIATKTDVAFAQDVMDAESSTPVLTTCPGDLSKDVQEAALVLGSCHSLALVDGAPAGDPIERAGLAGCDWTLLPQDRAASGSSSVKRRTARVMTRHAFRSELRRMSCVVSTEGFEGAKRWVVAKGAPEAMERTLRKPLPRGYKRGHKSLAARGYRVIALCAKRVPEDKDVSAVKAMRREECECDLDFIGFAVFACPTKPTSAPAIGVLAESSHVSVLITGDALLTACHVAAEVGITNRQSTVLLEASESGGEWHWATPTGERVAGFRDASFASLAHTHDLAVCGEGLQRITECNALAECVKHVRVYARTAPDQKEKIVNSMRAAGLRTMMCGDGTNDVGALKAAHVGVALLDGGVSSAGSSSSGRATAKNTYDKGDTKEKEHAGSSSQPGDVIAELTARMDAADDRSAGGRLALTVRPGDASLAAPFTARSGGVAPCVDLVRQGRATLVASEQMFKILGLNCLCMAYVMSVQFLDGVKFGDTQMTVGGLITAGMFLALSRTAPSAALAPSKPRCTIFTVYFFSSVFLQFAVHLTALWYTLDVAKAYTTVPPGAEFDTVPATTLTPDATDASDAPSIIAHTNATGGGEFVHPLESPFAPNLVNTVSFLVNTFIQTATVVVNYVGAPHCVTLYENKPLFYAVCVSYAALGIISTQVVPELNESVELFIMPSDLANVLCGVMACDLAVCWVIERTLNWAFPPRTSNAAAALLARRER